MKALVIIAYLKPREIKRAAGIRADGQKRDEARLDFARFWPARLWRGEEAEAIILHRLMR